MFAAELQAAAELAREAGRIVSHVYATDFAVHSKGAAGPVTEADKAANAYLVEALRMRFPGDGVVAEESVECGDALHKGRCWYVDPLDGTKEFVAKNGEFSVMVGLAVDGRAKVGAVYQPVTDKLYLGAEGEGAKLVQAGTTRALQVSTEASPSALRLVVSRSHRSAATSAVVKHLGLTEERQSGSVGLKIGLIAEQVADLYVHLSEHACLWDACAPEAILHAAGGRLTDLYGDAITYRGPDMKNRHGLLACNAAAFDAVLPHVTAVAADVLPR
ncbi:MAG: 3'(2'),5'-bisphosphate nucleotidase CysQ family protein [Polyangiales bacterium]